MSRLEELIKFCKSNANEKGMRVSELRKLLSDIPDDFYVIIRGARRRVSDGGWPYPLQEMEFSPKEKDFTLNFFPVVNSRALVINGLFIQDITEDNSK